MLKNIYLVDSILNDLYVKNTMNHLEIQKNTLPLHPLSERGEVQISNIKKTQRKI
ncbi:hypothetical protein FACS189455_2130 [Bacteroidia bacterium]|nr:hypothetical protein FACS189455_2130 [Bacteroidia bacterium]